MRARLHRDPTTLWSRPEDLFDSLLGHVAALSVSDDSDVGFASAAVEKTDFLNLAMILRRPSESNGHEIFRR